MFGYVSLWHDRKQNSTQSAHFFSGSKYLLFRSFVRECVSEVESRDADEDPLIRSPVRLKVAVLCAEVFVCSGRAGVYVDRWR